VKPFLIAELKALDMRSGDLFYDVALKLLGCQKTRSATSAMSSLPWKPWI
jgi:hypothetical protein